MRDRIYRVVGTLQHYSLATRAITPVARLEAHLIHEPGPLGLGVSLRASSLLDAGGGRVLGAGRGGVLAAWKPWHVIVCPVQWFISTMVSG